MRTSPWLLGLGLAAASSTAALAQQPRLALPDSPDLAAALLPEPRPALTALRLEAGELLGRFTPEVRSSAKLRARALELWRASYASRAAEISLHFTADPDWRPSLAAAAELIEDFLEASQLPREGVVEPAPPTPATGSTPSHSPGADVLIETVDPRTERRTRVRRPAIRRPVLFAPEHDERNDKPKTPDATGKRPDRLKLDGLGE